MTKAIWGLTLLVLCIGTAHAQAPQPEQPKPGEKTPKSDEKADTTETLQKGGDVRPWAQGVTPAEQKTALLAFREGNAQLNDGLFARAAETYRGALTHWKHPAIYYNLSKRSRACRQRRRSVTGRSTRTSSSTRRSTCCS
jgi:hypothetical protein